MGTRLAWIAVLLLASARPAGAEVVVQIEPGPGRDFAQRSGIDLASIEAQLKTELENVFQVARLEEYLQAFGDAQAFSTRGLGVDYASQARVGMVGMAANVSVSAEKEFVSDAVRSRPPVGALATTLSFMAGVNLGWLGLRPVTLFANFYRGSASIDEFDASLSNAGFHAQVTLLAPEHDESFGSVLFRWGGLAITSGIDYARMGLTLGQRFGRDIPISDGQQDRARILVDSTGQFEIDLRTITVPLELTTSVRLLYLFSLYGGVGFDWQLGGQSEMQVNLDGSMTGVVGSESQRIGTLMVRASESAEPSAGRMRGILGVQANIFVVRLFAQLNVIPGDTMLAGVTFGGRLVW